MIKISEMPSYKARRVMAELLPYVEQIHNNAIAIETKEQMKDENFTFIQFMRKISPVAVDSELQDKVVSIVTEKSIDEVKCMPMSEYIEALSSFSLKDLRDFFGWWLVIVKST